MRLLHVGDRDEAERLVAPLRAAPGIVQDTFAAMPYADVGTIHAEPDVPVRFEARSSLLGRLDDDAADAFTRGTGPDSGFLTELRLLGGRLADPPRHAVAGRQDGHFSLYTGTALTDDDTAAAAATRQARLHDALAPWAIGAPLLAFLSGPNRGIDEVAAAYGSDDFEAMRRIKTEADPTNVFCDNLNIPPLDT